MLKAKKHVREFLIALLMAMIAGCVVFPVISIFVKDSNGTAANIAGYLFLIPFEIYLLYKVYMACVTIGKEIRCPQCKNKLLYLVLDPSYSKKLLITGLPKNIPDNIENCPYCKTSFDTDIKS